MGIKSSQHPKTNRTDTTDSKCSPSLVNSTELAKTAEWVSYNWKNYFSSKYAHVFNRQGRSKNHVVKTNFFSPLIPIQEKGRRVPVHILDKVEKEIEKLQKNDMIEKLD